LNDLFQVHEHELDIPWDDLKQTQVNEIFDAWQALPEADRRTIELVLQEVHEMATEDGLRAIIEEAIRQDNQELVDDIEGYDSRHDKAVWTYIKARDVWEAAVRFARADTMSRGRYTALFTGYVVGYQTVGDGTNVIMTDCWDDPIGTIRAVGADTAVRDGWEELTDARSRFLVGRAASPGDGAWGTYAATGGIALANLTLGLQDHPEMSQNCLGYGTAWKIHTKLNGSTGPLDHRVKNESSNPSIAPPWYAVKWIKRTS